MELDLLGERQGSERGRDYAYRILRYNIVTMQMLPGFVINEAMLTEQLEMSRTPIREALILLKEEGLVDIMPQRGSKVTHISLHSVREGFFMRRVLESVMIRDLAGKLSNGQNKRLKDNLMAQEAALSEGAEGVNNEFFILDDEMHKMIYDFCGWERIWENTHKVCSHFDRVRYLDSAAHHVNQKLILEQHRQLFYYLSLGLPPNADVDGFCTEHLGRWLGQIQNTLATYQDYFKD